MRYEYCIEWFENYCHRPGSAEEAYYTTSWITENNLPSFTEEYVLNVLSACITHSNRHFYVSKYNAERAFYKAKQFADTDEIPVPDWLWHERALYELHPPTKPEEWDPQQDALETKSVCSSPRYA